ncbi:hypothetical protein N7539_005951 [Penicillium diatomitis]|uniref:Uncharacterized protein n=1 Tax=Penicillium diatomitis TaxID=2819901 RepID=A0A9W9X5T1_9EURO|nr:uncharacterized protein N7539_005951 [Penicillium diatomitis]KAJ5484155.1 hypothetical protein N7539_005951 [Penicillium diatomitis]
MAPDLNSLPPSRSSSTSSSLPFRPASTISPGTTSPSQAASQQMVTPPRPSRGSSNGRPSVSERRRSAAGMHINLNDPSVAASGNMGDGTRSEHRSSMGQAFRTASPISLAGSPIFTTADPHHQRAPSLGELHQELEQEQEAQVNRLLQTIRSQQAQLDQFYQQHQQSQSSASGTMAIDDTPTPASERSFNFFSSVPQSTTATNTANAPTSRVARSSFSLRRPSQSTSQATSPHLFPREPSRGAEASEIVPIFRDGLSRRSSRDDGAFYQAEAAMLNRENLMLRQRIRELERQISDLTSSSTSGPTAPVSATTETISASAPEDNQEASAQVMHPTDAKD